MTATDPRVRDALAAAASTRDVDVERLWHEFAAAETQPARHRGHWLIPLAAAAAVLLVVAFAVVLRGTSVGTANVTAANRYDLAQLPAWPNGVTATTYPLPAPASTPVSFDSPTSRVVVYYTEQPIRLCVLVIDRSEGQRDHLGSIGCEGAPAYRKTPVSSGTDWLLGTVPPRTHEVEVKVDGRPVTAQVVKQAHMPRAVFFVRYPPAVPERVVTWQYVDAHGRVIERGSHGPRVVLPPTAPPGSPPAFQAAPVSAMVRFDEPSQPTDPAGSHRVLLVYWAGDKSGWCSNEKVVVNAKPQTVFQQCGDSTAGVSVFMSGFWLPRESAAASKISVWGVMPPGATKTVFVMKRTTVTMRSMEATGMPDAVYAGSFDRTDASAVVYALDSDGRVVAAATWRFAS